VSAGTRVPYQEARAVADALVSALAPACHRIEIAGSVRRGDEDAGDVELVVLPKVRQETVPDGLFETREIAVDEVSEVLDWLIADGRLMVHPSDPKRGDRYAKLVHVPTGLQVDLFSVKPPAEFGVIHLIRTGPASYSHRFVTDVRSRGFHVAEGALHAGSMGFGCPKSCRIVATPEERDVYTAVRWPWVNPEDRR
jgi:DNA polymerase/3'-5' exonuclease PolX